MSPIDTLKNYGNFVLEATDYIKKNYGAMIAFSSADAVQGRTQSLMASHIEMLNNPDRRAVIEKIDLRTKVVGVISALVSNLLVGNVFVTLGTYILMEKVANVYCHYRYQNDETFMKSASPV